ncbi:MAG: glutaminyl-peptide cyclotransferase [Acetobacteraceae bacterium]
MSPSPSRVMTRRHAIRMAGTASLLTLAASRLGQAVAGEDGPTAWPPQGGHVQLHRERALEQTGIPVYHYRIAHTYPHDRSAYTEGLVWDNGTIYEGTGLYGRSKLMQWELRSGRVLRQVSLDPHDFGEGITFLNGTLYQLTYLENACFTYDLKSFRRTGRHAYATQGWGLTHDGRQLIMGDGSSALVFRDPQTFAVTRRLFVTDAVGPVGFLNELEYADGRIYANVWQTNFIAIISPDTGKIIGWIDLTGLNPDPSVLVYPFVLNGVAFNQDTGRLLVTGKCWPHLYEIDLVPRA